ncbi:ATPase, partial [Streptomyces sp. ICBB 8177]
MTVLCGPSRSIGEFGQGFGAHRRDVLEFGEPGSRHGTSVCRRREVVGRVRNTTRTRPDPVRPARGNFTPPGRDTGSPADTSAPPEPSGSRFSPNNWRVRTRLNAILLIPVLVALVVGGFNVDNSINRWRQADDAVRTANLVRAAATYSHALLDERDQSVVPLLAGQTNSPVVKQVRAATDQAAAAFDAAVKQMPQTDSLKRRLALFRQGEGALPQVRKNAYTAKLTGTQTEEAYVNIQHTLMEFDNELGYGSNNVAAYGRTLYAVSLAMAAESLTRSIGTHILVQGHVPSSVLRQQETALSSYSFLEGVALAEYQNGGTPQDMDRLKAALATATTQGKEQLDAAKAKALAAGQQFVTPPSRDTMTQDIASGASAEALKAKGITPDSYMASTTLAFDAYRSVESALTDQAASDAAGIASGAKRDAILDSAAVLLGVLLAFVVAALMARSMSRSMRKLRTSAFDVAEQRLPALVDQLSRNDPGRVDTRVTPIPITSGDEIGEVARAFDQVHREAVRLAAEQALLRGNVNAIFTNLSLRNQGLIQRQLGLITDLENNEADPDQLENLFQLDHLATRMRRNGENLLVLAGEEPGRRWNQPVPLVDVLRAAASEVEDYERIEISGVPETDIHGAAVTDLVHLLAELLENATSFSSPQTRVKVTATRLPDGRIMVEIHDKGIGLTPEDFADINHKLADPPTVDASVSQRMGLFVVGRLADRHGIRVQLRPSGEQAGTTSLVMLPEPITHGGGGDEPETRDFTVSRIVPEHAGPDAPEVRGGGLTAAELGFDDRRYEVPDDAGSLDPVGRSLMREERRAALEAAAGERRVDTSALFRDEAPAADGTSGEHEQPYPGYDEEYREPYEQGYEQPYDTGYPAAYPGYEERAGETSHQDDGAFGIPHQTAYETTGEHPVTGAPQAEYPADRPETDAFAPRHGWEQGYSMDGWEAPPAPAAVDPEPPREAPERVGYDAPDAAVGGSPAVTDAGLPRRDAQWRQQPEPDVPDEERAQEQGGAQDADEWRSANDDNWERAERARDPKAGGVTPSGLPRRVPRANLVPGAAQQTPQDGPQVSRAPEDVRGRLSNLRRGIQQGRSAGAETTSFPTDSQGPGPNH